MFLKDTTAADLTAIVEFMYRGSVNVAQSQLASFIKTAEMLQVQGLSGGEDKVGTEAGVTLTDGRFRDSVAGVAWRGLKPGSH